MPSTEPKCDCFVKKLGQGRSGPSWPETVRPSSTQASLAFPPWNCDPALHCHPQAPGTLIKGDFIRLHSLLIVSCLNQTQGSCWDPDASFLLLRLDHRMDWACSQFRPLTHSPWSSPGLRMVGVLSVEGFPIHSWPQAPAHCKSPRAEPASLGTAYRNSECGLASGRSRERSDAPSISPTYQRNHALPLGEEDEGKEEEQIAFCRSF